MNVIKTDVQRCREGREKEKTLGDKGGRWEKGGNKEEREYHQGESERESKEKGKGR